MTTKGEVPPGRPAIPADLARRPRTLVVVPGSGRARLAAMARLSLRIDFDGADSIGRGKIRLRSEEHPSELQSLMRISYAVFCLKKKHTLVRFSRNHFNDLPQY